jgi:predicted component of type VI protein secretion system
MEEHMAKLYLKSEDGVLKEIALDRGTALRIGRLPDNDLQVDNPAVSGRHATISWEYDHYIIEDNSSLNGTYVNNARIDYQLLKDGDSVLIGKHTLLFEDKPEEVKPQEKSMAPVITFPKVDSTVALDSKGKKETPLTGAPHPQVKTNPVATASGKMKTPAEAIARLTVIEGKTDQPEYLLSGKMSVIGKSEMASIRLKGWFAPQMAALISKRETEYVIAASERATKVKVNDEEIVGQKSLSDGDVIEVAGVKMTFGFQE